MGRRAGWDTVPVRSDFLADPEFRRLRRLAENERAFLAAVGLWLVASADAWRDDDENAVLEALGDDPELAELLTAAKLVEDGHLRGFEKRVTALRARRAEDADRKRRTPRQSGGVHRSPSESSVEVEVEVEEEGNLSVPVDPSNQKPGAPVPQGRGQRPKVRGFASPMEGAPR